jgi:hypothetical protein
MIGTGMVRARVASRSVWLIVIAGLVLLQLFLMSPAGSVHHVSGAPKATTHVATGHWGQSPIRLTSMIGDAIMIGDASAIMIGDSSTSRAKPPALS